MSLQILENTTIYIIENRNRKQLEIISQFNT